MEPLGLGSVTSAVRHSGEIMDQKISYPSGKVFRWGSSCLVCPDDPYTLQVAKRLMHRNVVYFKQPDGSYAPYNVGVDLALGEKR
jgi:hypothetical protein